MRTPKQAAASRANGAKSRGPVTPEGKAISSRNALKYGLYAESHIIPGEDSTDFDALVESFHQLYGPSKPSKPSTSKPSSAPPGSSSGSPASRPNSGPANPKPPLNSAPAIPSPPPLAAPPMTSAFSSAASIPLIASSNATPPSSKSFSPPGPHPKPRRNPFIANPFPNPRVRFFILRLRQTPRSNPRPHLHPIRLPSFSRTPRSKL